MRTYLPHPNNERNWFSRDFRHGRSDWNYSRFVCGSRKQTQSLSVDIETKVLNDLAERMHQIVIERPQLINVISKANANSPEVAYAHDILFKFAHVFHMRKRNVLSDNEWTGWLRWMKSAFEQGEIMQIWKSTIEMEK